MNTSEYTDKYLEKVKQSPEALEFSELMDLIEKDYDFKATAFKNGELHNAEDENLGSCKVFSFAQLHGLSVDETLACFGTYYRHDVLQNPDGEDHQNIRNFMQSGWDGIVFSQVALSLKAG